SRAHSVAFGFSLGVGSKVGDITDPQLQAELRTRLADALQTDQGILGIDVLAPSRGSLAVLMTGGNDRPSRVAGASRLALSSFTSGSVEVQQTSDQIWFGSVPLRYQGGAARGVVT